MPWAIAGLALATLFSLFAPWAWWTDLFSHFRPHYVAAGLVLAVIAAAVGGRRWLSFGAAALAIANAVPLIPFASTGVAASAATPALKVVFLNLWKDNFDHARTLEFLLGENPDVVVLAEIAPHWAEALAPIRERYPYRVENFDCRQYRTCQMALYSRRPWADAGIEPTGGPIPLAWARFEEGAGRTTIVGTHLMAGMSAKMSQARRAQFEGLKTFLRGVEGGVVLAGDFNTTPWSADFPKLAPGARVAHSGPTFSATWPAQLGPFGIPIDHVFAGRGAEVTNVRIGPAVGSDHAPVVFRVGSSR